MRARLDTAVACVEGILLFWGALLFGRWNGARKRFLRRLLLWRNFCLTIILRSFRCFVTRLLLHYRLIAQFVIHRLRGIGRRFHLIWRNRLCIVVAGILHCRLQVFHHLVELVFGCEDGVLTIVQNTGEKRSLEPQFAEHGLLETAGRHEVDDLDVALLADAVYPCDALFQHGRIPRQVDIDDRRRHLQVESGAACVGGEEDAAVGLIHEVVDQILPFGRGNTAVKIFEADVLFAQLLGNEPRHTFPLTKDDHLLVTTLNDVADDVHHLVHLGIVTRLLVENIGAVAYATHLLQRQHQSVAVGL